MSRGLWVMAVCLCRSVVVNTGATLAREGCDGLGAVRVRGHRARRISLDLTRRFAGKMTQLLKNNKVLIKNKKKKESIQNYELAVGGSCCPHHPARWSPASRGFLALEMCCRRIADRVWKTYYAKKGRELINHCYLRLHVEMITFWIDGVK